MHSYIEILERDHPVLLIGFSHIETPPGYYSQYRVLKQLPYSLMFLNCPENSYYLRAIPGIGDDVTGIARTLEQRIAGIAPKRVVCFGNSMGAFGALLYGMLLGADLVIAVGPEVLLGTKGCAMNSAARDKGIADDAHAKGLINLIRSRPHVRKIALFGEKSLPDMVCALALQEIGEDCFSIRNCFHSVAPFIHGSVDLASFIADCVDGGSDVAFLRDHRGDFITCTDAIRRLYDGMYLTGRLADVETLGRSLPPNASDASLSYIYGASARRSMQAGARTLALALVSAAYALNPSDIEAVTLLLRWGHGRAFASSVRPESLIDAIRLHRFDTTTSYLRFLAAILTTDGLAGEAVRREIDAVISNDRLRTRLLSEVAAIRVERSDAGAGWDEHHGPAVARRHA